jgi:hypothetical protein
LVGCSRIDGMAKRSLEFRRAAMPQSLKGASMIPSNTGSASIPLTSGNLVFHVIIDDFNRTFSMDGPGDPNGIRLHYEIMRLSREQKTKLRDSDLRAESQKVALAEMRAHFPDYTFWANAQAKWANLDSKLPLEAKQAGTHPRKDDLR